MRQRLLLDDDEPQPRPRSGGQSIEQLLEQMATVMHYKTDKGLRWYARATKGKPFGFAEGLTAREAMEGALALKDKQ